MINGQARHEKRVSREEGGGRGGERKREERERGKGERACIQTTLWCVLAGRIATEKGAPEIEGSTHVRGGVYVGWFGTNRTAELTNCAGASLHPPEHLTAHVPTGWKRSGKSLKLR